MSKRAKRQRAEPPMKKRSAVLITDRSGFEHFCCENYVSLDRCPEIVTGCNKIAELIATMTIYLMQNTDKGDIRVRNELSRKVDINPTEYMTRSTWMQTIVMNLLLHGRGNAVVVPHTQSGLLGDLEPIAAHRVSFMQDGRSYKIMIDGLPREPSEILHFVYRPDPLYPWQGRGFTVEAKTVAKNLLQEAETANGFMKSEYKPSMIIKVDAINEKFAEKSGRQKLLEDYVETNRAGEPWVIPADQIQIEQIRPLSLTDLAIDSMIKIDKQTVAAILGVPAFLLGVGEFNEAEWNNFVNTTVHSIAQSIEQEMTKKLLISPSMYWKFNIRSLYAYNMREIADIYKDLRASGIVDGNEVRDALGLEPKEGLEELVMLENYIPTSRLGDQLKLKQNQGEGE